MDARSRIQRRNEQREGGESGQSLVEFLLLLPVIIGMVVVLVRMNAAVTTSIVSQKYVRMMTFRLNANSAIYPVMKNSVSFRDNFTALGYNRMVLGLSSQRISDEDGKPKAQTQLVARTPALARGAGPAQSEPAERGVVRVRTTMEICTQSNFVNDGGTIRPLEEKFMRENMVLDFCAAPERGNG